jgi:hypothetical protein
MSSVFSLDIAALMILSCIYNQVRNNLPFILFVWNFSFQTRLKVLLGLITLLA